MKKIPTYVINMEECKDRKMYMENLLVKTSNILSVSFLPAVNGAKKTQAEISQIFNTSLAYKRYGRILNKSEIGCTLSHYKCYEKIVNSGTNYALILEDDITLIRDISDIINLIPYIDTNKPTIIFLSGDYWYYMSHKINKQSLITSVYDAVGSYAYLINTAAAKLILKENKIPSCVSDHWSLYRKQGVRLRAIYPYMIDANIEPLPSTINQTYFGERRKNMPLKYQLDSYELSLVKRILLKSGKFVSKIRK